MTEAATGPCAYACDLVAVLPAGILTVAVERSDAPPCDLFDFAARNNPKRSFLFLSKVLGKHVPVSPDVMHTVHLQLARKLPPLEGPVLFIGMAETATGLGQGVFEAWLGEPASQEGLFFCTSRYRAANTGQLQFEESHSHAPVLFLNLPVDAELRAQLGKSRSLVLVDDEISTGDTLANLAVSLRAIAPDIGHAHIVSLTDFMGETGRSRLSERIGLPTTFGSLLEGSWSFSPGVGDGVLRSAPLPAQGTSAPLVDGGFGRMGIARPLRVSEHLVEELAATISACSRVLVLGTGEFMHASYVLGRALARVTGADVHVHATTRSPILPWGPVGEASVFEDNYAEGVANYLYSDPSMYEHVLICHETPVNSALSELATRIGARLIHFTTESPVAECPVR